MTHRDIVEYLLQRKLINAESIVLGDLTATNVSRRHLSFRIASKQSRSFFIKYAAAPAEKDALRREAATYELFQSRSDDDGPKKYLPRFYGYDEKRSLLILELLSEARNLREYHLRYRRFSKSVAEALAYALSALHKFSGAEALRSADSRFKTQPPWVLSIHRPNPSLVRHSSAANFELIKIIRQFPEFCDALEALRQEWKNQAFIHCDIKWDNCLLSSGNSNRNASLKIVDWELASNGDPCWDVGSAFSDYLAFWLFSIPIIGDASPERFSEFARYPLKNMLPAIGRLWSAYAKLMECSSDERSELLIRSVKYSAARLIQTGYEHMQTSAQLSGAVVCLLQLAMNLLLRPHQAASQLLEII